MGMEFFLISSWTIMLLPRWGAMSLSSNTQGDALGCRLVGPPGRPGSLGCVEHTYFFFCP